MDKKPHRKTEKKSATPAAQAAGTNPPAPRFGRRTLIGLAVVLAALAGLLFFVVQPGRQAKLPAVASAGSPAAAAVLSGARFVGGQKCAQCHAAEYKAWRGSHHDLAMQAATPTTVLGNFERTQFRGDGMAVEFFRRDEKFFVRAEGPDGKPGDFEVKYTFGVTPLQQYLLALPDGKLQAFTVAWDSRAKTQGGQRWFHLYPGQRFSHRDELHWSGVQQNWNFMCADCHSTHLQKKYDPATLRFSTSWSEVNVSCEACHGPGSRHVDWAVGGRRDATPDKGLTVALDERRGVRWNHDVTSGNAVRSQVRASGREIEVCAQCHARRAQLAEGYHAGRPLLDHYQPSLPAAPLYFADGQQRDEVYTWGSFLQSRMHGKGVTCSDCHEPHGAKLRAAGNAVCAQCHAPAKYDATNHHFHSPGGKGAQCVACHMPERLYMVIDGRHDHGFRVPRPDLTVAHGANNSPNACNACHRDKDAQWAASAVARWYGPARRQEMHFGATLATAGRLDADAIAALLALTGDAGVPAIARATALQTLATQPGPAMQSATHRLALDGDDLMRLTAAEAAILLPPPERAAVLLPLLRDARLAIRIAAASGLLDVPRTDFSAQQAAELDAAIAEYRRVQAYNADRAEAQTNLGQLEAGLGNAVAATAAFREAIRINPAFVPAYVGLSMLQSVQGNEPEAEKTLRLAVALVPDSADAHHALGLSLVRGKRLREALPALQRAARLQPEASRYAYVYAVAQFESGDAQGAILTLKQALARHPADRALTGTLVQYAAQSGDQATAADYAARFQALQ